MWWLIIQRFPQCRNPFMAIFNGLHEKDTGSGKMKLSRLDPGLTALLASPVILAIQLSLALRSRRILNR